MDLRDILRARKAIDQVEDDLERRKRGRQEYRPGQRREPDPPPARAAVVPVRSYAARSIPQVKGFTRSQTCLLMVLTAILTTICICGSPFVVMRMVGTPPASQVVSRPVSTLALPTRRPNNHTTDGLIIAHVVLRPFVPDNAFTDPGPGNWWRVEVTAQNPTSRPITLRGYDVVLRDAVGNEYWYDQGMSMFGVKNGMVERINPGVSVTMPVVFNLPGQMSGLSVHYEGAIISVGPDNVVN